MSRAFAPGVCRLTTQWSGRGKSWRFFPAAHRGRSARRESFHSQRRCMMMPEGIESKTYWQWLSQSAPHVQLHHLMTGYWISAALGVAAELHLADRMAEGAQASADLARSTGTH